MTIPEAPLRDVPERRRPWVWVGIWGSGGRYRVPPPGGWHTGETEGRNRRPIGGIGGGTRVGGKRRRTGDKADSGPG